MDIIETKVAENLLCPFMSRSERVHCYTWRCMAWEGDKMMGYCALIPDLTIPEQIT